MAEKLRRWLYGRYGADRLTKHLMILAIVLLIVSLFWGRRVLYPISIAVMVYAYFRTFSKKYPKEILRGNGIRKIYRKNKKAAKRNVYEKDASYIQMPGLPSKNTYTPGKGTH